MSELLSNIDKRALREAAGLFISGEGEHWWDEKQLTHEDGLGLSEADGKFIAAAKPAAVLALLDELEALQNRSVELPSFDGYVPHIAKGVPSPESLCQFVMLNYANYQGAWLCGKSSEILSFLLIMAGHKCEKVACTINGVGHLYVRSGDLILDPSIAQFGDYPEISRGEHPCTAMGYVENSTEPQNYRNAIIARVGVEVK